MMKNILLIIGAGLMVVACVSQQPRISNTTSGRPEAIFYNTDLDDVRARIIERCNILGAIIEDAGDNQVVCSKTLEGGSAVLTQLLIGNAYSTTPERKIRFTIYSVGHDVRVTAYQWIETQMPFGQTKKVELNRNDHFNDLQNILFSIGGASAINIRAAAGPSPSSNSAAINNAGQVVNSWAVPATEKKETPTNPIVESQASAGAMPDEATQRNIIYSMQTTLKSSRYYDGPADGFMNNKTYAAIMKYKNDKIGSKRPVVFDDETLRLFNIR